MARRRRGRYGYGGYGWKLYVPVAQRRAEAARHMEQHFADGGVADPVRIDGRTIARSFWGRRWCEHLESFADYDNRLPRGRSYVRNGSVCHLEIGAGKITAKVAGTGSTKAAPSAAPMKGAVHGEATRTASTPERKASASGCRKRQAPGTSCASVATGNAPEKDKPNAKKSTAMPPTKAGDWS